ncbi:hypothetical protein [Peribacillus aracenensis]|uniref:hypothetical protein n=1 Tax=Peribacillus aracenensis TaxID=2976708 RepID=UPI0021A96B11|nr:hypothetical protein [Peribacillus sp. BBB004]
MMNITFIGRISTIDSENMTARVLREDKEIVTGEFSILNRGDDWTPEVGDSVCCLSLTASTGWILGGA